MKPFRQLALFLAVCLALPLAAQAAPKAEVGKPAPDFELKSVSDGSTHKLSDHKGEIVVITFQSTECPWNYMRESAGYERVLYPMAKEYQDKGVQFLAINSNSTESTESLASYVAEHNTPYPILKDPGNQVADVYGGKTTPHFYVIDREGVLRYAGGFEKAPSKPEDCGNVDEQYLKPVLEALLAGQEPPVTTSVPKGCTIKRG